MIGRVVWVDYTTDEEMGVLVRLSVRMKNGTKRNVFVEGTEPYIFAPEDENVPNREYIKRTESGYESLFDKPLQKVVTETPKQAGGLTDNFSWTGEADVPYYRRVSIHDDLSGYIDIPEGDNFVHIDDIDTDVEYSDVIEPRISIADIEVRVPEDESFDEMTEKANQPINVICSYDTQSGDYTVFFFDKFNNLKKSEIRPQMEAQLEGTGIEEYGDADIELVVSDTEVGMLNSFIDYVRERGFDLISGWNFTDFDYQYIIDRINTLDNNGEDIYASWLSPFDRCGYSSNPMMQIRGLPSFDQLKAFCDKLTFSNWRSRSLEYVANEELGVGKIDDVNINKDWKNTPSRLIAYNIVDVILTVALDDANDIHNFFYEMTDACSIPVYDGFYEKRLVDGYVMSRRRKDEVLPTADESELVENAGGYVAEAINGMKEHVGVVDLKSLYPSAIITWNLSTETVSTTPENFNEYVKIPKVPEPKDVVGKIEEDQIEWDWLYASLDKEGIIPRTSKKLFEKRNREKEKMKEAENGSKEEKKWERKQGATKIIMNSIYGNLSSQYYRLSNEYLGDATTSTARYTLWKGENSIEEMGYEHIYSDTDSHFIQLTEDTVEGRVAELIDISDKMDRDASEIAHDIGIEGEHPFLDGSLHGDKYTCMLWESEKIWKKYMALGTKKRYAGDLEWKE